MVPNNANFVDIVKEPAERKFQKTNKTINFPITLKFWTEMKNFYLWKGHQMESEHLISMSLSIPSSIETSDNTLLVITVNIYYT